jgi:hypothetical protein
MSSFLHPFSGGCSSGFQENKIKTAGYDFRMPWHVVCRVASLRLNKVAKHNHDETCLLEQH